MRKPECGRCNTGPLQQGEAGERRTQTDANTHARTSTNKRTLPCATVLRGALSLKLLVLRGASLNCWLNRKAEMSSPAAKEEV